MKLKLKIDILEKKPIGFTIRVLKTNTVQLLPETELKNRIQWGIYEINKSFSPAFVNEI